MTLVICYPENRLLLLHSARIYPKQKNKDDHSSCTGVYVDKYIGIDDLRGDGIHVHGYGANVIPIERNFEETNFFENYAG